MSDKLTVAVITTKKNIVHFSVSWCCFSYFGRVFFVVFVFKKKGIVVCYLVSKGIFQAIDCYLFTNCFSFHVSYPGVEMTNNIHISLPLTSQCFLYLLHLVFPNISHGSESVFVCESSDPTPAVQLQCPCCPSCASSHSGYLYPAIYF